MDIISVPLLDSIVLTGLDFSMKPSRARYEIEKGFIKGFPELKVMHQIKSLAVMVYNQEKNIPFYHNNVCEGRNVLAYFITAMHRQQAPQPQTHTRQGSVSSTSSSNSSSTSCKSTGSKKNCELPKLCTTSMLPLGYWDSLYYALVTEIRTLHKDLQLRYGFGCETGTSPLHYRGIDGTAHNHPITALQVGAMLETAWYILMDNRLVATLDDAVRVRKMREAAAKAEDEEIKLVVNSLINNVVVKEPEIPERPPMLYGLMDINDLAPEIVTALLWEKHAREVNQACCENFEDESMMTAYRAEQHQKAMADSLAFSTPMPSAVPCSCHGACVCNLKCDQDNDKCTCQNNAVHSYFVYNEEATANAPARTNYAKQNLAAARNQYIGAAPHGLAALQIAAAATAPDPEILSAYHIAGGHIDPLVRGGSSAARPRKDTAHSDLAYVPNQSTASRGAKDAYPLGFYDRSSGHRYPNLRLQSGETSPFDAHAYYGVQRSNSNTIVRKAVPTSITAPPVPRVPTQYGYGSQVFTPPNSSPSVHQTFDQAGQVTYQTDTQLQTHNNASVRHEDQATIASHVGTILPTQKSKSFDQPPRDQADDYISLLPHHPSTADDPSEPFPRLSHAATTSPSKKEQQQQQQQQKQKARAATTTTDNRLPTSSQSSSVNGRSSNNNNSKTHTRNPSLDKSLPPMPQPDFITPRPAARQRYVSAGGNAKLADRAEIAGPAFTAGDYAVPGGLTSPPNGSRVSKEELEAKMSDAEWVRKNFGEAAVGKAMAASARSSDESGRSSGEKERRDRTSSGASKRERLKRVFSRKGSMGEEE